MANGSATIHTEEQKYKSTAITTYMVPGLLLHQTDQEHTFELPPGGREINTPVISTSTTPDCSKINPPEECSFVSWVFSHLTVHIPYYPVRRVQPEQLLVASLLLPSTTNAKQDVAK